MSIRNVILPLTEAIEAEINLDNALAIHQQAVARNLDDAPTLAKVNTAWWTADKAYAALADAVADAPDSKVKEAIVNGALRDLLRRHDAAPAVTAG